ncbi:MAG: fimbria major subunit [Bacteroidales bacterium]|nr:fimbria major subunit [Bacteroidales bacterium]
MKIKGIPLGISASLLFPALLALFLLTTSCVNDSHEETPNSTKTFAGDVAYIVVRINDVGATSTRAGNAWNGTPTKATEGDYGSGTADEYAVNDAHFYFYDDAGVFFTRSMAWNDGEPIDGDNVEFLGKTVVLLQGLTNRSYPRYIVTVLNQPEGFAPETHLEDMATKLASIDGLGIAQGTTSDGEPTYFTMSTSSYINDADGANDGRPAYYVTELTEDDFLEEPIPNDLGEIDPVEIYVERLAAKVSVDVSQSLASGATTTNDGKTLYRVNETISGSVGTTVYVQITGWGLNCTAKHSNIVKPIDASWNNNGSGGSGNLGTGWTWNVPKDSRSHWGKSFNYGQGTTDDYPTSSGGASNANGSGYDGTMLNDYLDYISWNELTTQVGNTAYCAENTNIPALLADKNSSAITSVLVQAVVCDENGSPLDLVRYGGYLYTRDGYLDYVMARLGLDIYFAVPEGDQSYTEIGRDCITLSNSYTDTDGETRTYWDGYAYAVLNEDYFTSNSDYSYYIGAEDDGVINYEEITAEEAEAIITAALQEYNDDHLYANVFNEGAMYYNVPIEHLNRDAVTDSNGYATGELAEANYGVVRNHWYNLTINSIESLGKGVYDPDEVIIPTYDEGAYDGYLYGSVFEIHPWTLNESHVVF